MDEDAPLCMILLNENEIIKKFSNTLQKELKEVNVQYDNMIEGSIIKVLPIYKKGMYRVKTNMNFKKKNISCYASEYKGVVYIELLHGIDDVISYIGHAFNNPVSSSVELVTLLNNKKPLTDEQKNYIKKIKENNLELTKNINNIVDYLKIQLGIIHNHKEEFNIKECFGVLERVIDKKKNVNVNFDINNCFLNTDKRNFTDMCYHIISHSMSVMDKGVVNIKSKIKNNELVIYFLDTGAKISKTRQDTLFKGFLNDNYKLNNDGLGLPIALGLSKINGGTLILESTSDMGSIYKFSINISDSSD